MEILKDLDKVNWHKLSHAYGSAEDVPRYLRALLSQDQSERDVAYTFFHQYVWHQRTVYSVTAHTIPFLVELLGAESVLDREGILFLLHDLANGRSYVEVHYHIDPKWMDKKFAEEGTDYESQLLLERSYVENARRAVLDNYQVYLQLLQHDDPKLVGFAIYLLSDLAELPIGHFSLFRNIFEQHHSDEVKNSALHGIRKLQIDFHAKRTFFEGVFDSVDDDRLKSTAALGTFEATEKDCRSDVFDYLLDFYEFLEINTKWGQLDYSDRAYPDPWGPGITTWDIKRACVARSSFQNLSEVEKMAEVMQSSAEVFGLIKDVLFKLLPSPDLKDVFSTSGLKDGTYVVDFYRRRLHHTDWTAAEIKDGASLAPYRPIIGLLLRLDNFWEVESNLLNVFGLPHSKAELQELFRSSGETSE